MSLKGTVWVPIGPSPILEGGSPANGLVTAIAVHPSNSNVVFIGTAGGGVWRTRDGAITWKPLFDHELALGIGEPCGIAIDPRNTDIVYAGTSQRVVLGTGNAGFFGNPDSSQGLYKSTDGGESWVQLGSGFPAANNGNAFNFVGQNINVVIVDPAGGNTVYLASSSGVFTSSDGGLNWTAGANAGGDARSLVLDTSSAPGSRILYAGISGRGVFQSADGGANWTPILTGTTPVVAAAIGGAPKGFNKVIVAIPPPTLPSPGGVQVLYATLEGTGGANDPVGVFVSTNQGGGWTRQAASGMPTNTQGGYSFHMAVDPASPGDGANDIIYFGAVSQAKSTDSGSSFTALSVPHADTHAWTFVLQPSSAPSVVFCGNDGGIDRSTDGGVTWSALGAGGLQTGLVYNIDVKPDATASEVVCALQDNGLLTTSGVASPAWSSPQGGDGYDVAYDGVTPGRVYGTSGFWPAPCTRAFFSAVDGADFPALVPSGQDISPWGTSSDQSCGVFPITTAPSNPGHVYVSGNQNLWQSRDGGVTWRKLSAFAGTGDIDVAAADGNNVVIAVGGQVFVTTNALAAGGVTFTNITRNLPARNVPRALFDPVDPNVIYAVLGGFNGSGPGQSGHIFRTTIGATAWSDISPRAGALSEPIDLPFNAIALDGTEVPTTIYVGTDLGVLRSVDGGNAWTVLDDIHFPRVPVTDLVLNQTAGMLFAGTYGRGVFKFAKPAGPVISVHLEHDLDFGTVCKGPAYLTLTVYNVGSADLTIQSVQRLMGSSDFSVLATPGTPLVVGPGEDIEFTVRYTPTLAGTQTAIIRVTSDDPGAPVVDLAATGLRGAGKIATAITNSGDFGNVCVGCWAHTILTINNAGTCSLSISSIVSGSPDFPGPAVLSYPLVVSAGGSIDVEVRFRPSTFGAKTGAITIFSDDPSGPHTINVAGVAPAPLLNLAIADSGDFGKCCVGAFVDEPLVLHSEAGCALSVSAIVSSSPEFVVPGVLSYPMTIRGGDSLSLPIRFLPTSHGSKSAVISVTSNDPRGPRTLAVSGVAPSGKLVVTGSTVFGGVRRFRRKERTVSVCNMGSCDLRVTRMHLRQRTHRVRILNNPFPVTLPAGSCLEVAIQYFAKHRGARPCELVIESDDPETPRKCLDVVAYTIWETFPQCRKSRETCRGEHTPCPEERHGRGDAENDEEHEEEHEEDDD